jgi:hypothetical protein
LAPIRSILAEVENKLGLLKEIEENHFRYENVDLMVSIVYSKEPCSGKESGSYMQCPERYCYEHTGRAKKRCLLPN